MGTSLQQQIIQALLLARRTGRPVAIPGAGGIQALPNGLTSMPQQGVNVSQPAAAPPQMGTDTGLNYSTPIPGSVYNPLTAATPSIVLPPQTITARAPQPVLNQVNPNVQTFAGQPGWGTTNPAAAAAQYRLQHGIGSAQELTTDQLNAQSLAAAQAGRTSFNPQLAAQYGQPMAAGQYGPPTTVVNALSVPQQAPQMAAPVAANQNQLAGGAGYWTQPGALGSWYLPNVHWLQGLLPPAQQQGGGTA